MNGRSGFSNGYSDGRHDRNDGGYDSPGSLGVDSYRGRTGRDRRPGGYGGFEFEDTLPVPQASSRSPARSTDREYRDWQQQSKSRSRTRDYESPARSVEPPTRRQRAQDVSLGGQYGSSRTRDVNHPGPVALGGHGAVAEAQAIEGSYLPCHALLQES